MIQANELRVGQTYSHRGRAEVMDNELLSYLLNSSNYDFTFHDFSPIPLTEEILLKCGFNKINASGLKYYNNGKLNITLDFSINYDAGQRVNLKSLHQLQNLYFALTGEELTFKKQVAKTTTPPVQ